MVARKEEELDAVRQLERDAEIEAWRSQLAARDADVLRLRNFAERKPVSDEIVRKIREIMRDKHVPEDLLADFIVFIEPLVANMVPTTKGLESAVMLGRIFWSLAVKRGLENHRAAVDSMCQRLGMTAGQDSSDFRLIAAQMRKRHKFLFPHFWKRMHENVSQENAPDQREDTE